MKPIAVVFPGQGSQSVGMLKDLANEFPEITETYHIASNVLGYDLWELVLNGPASKLDQTDHTQPALLAGSYALWKILQKTTPLQPAFLAGHSLGEYTALVCAGAIDFTDAIDLVAKRGQYMQEAVPFGQGGLAAIIGLENDVVAKLCKTAAEGDILSPANFNTPGQVVISGHLSALERAITLAKEEGAKLAKLLPVSVPSHCILMKPAAEKLKKCLEALPIKTPQIPIVNNVDVAIYQNADIIRDGLVRQLYMPVRWVETIQLFADKGIKQVIECGPGKVLTGLNKRINAEMQLTHTSDLGSLHALLATSLKME